jgi:hypothetical protein
MEVGIDSFAAITPGDGGKPSPIARVQVAPTVHIACG